MLVLPMLVVGCAARARVKANSEIATDADDRRWESSGSERPIMASSRLAALAPAPPVARTADPARGRVYAIGVQHDLSLAPAAAATPACGCWTVAYGSPEDPKFRWHAGPPHDVETDVIAVGIAPSGACPRAASVKSKRPSISGVARRGNDVIVWVESVAEGHPVMSGVLTVRPHAGGALVVTPDPTRSNVARVPATTCRFPFE